MSNKLRVTTLLFDNFELLDVFGPLEMYGWLKDGVELRLVSENGQPVKSYQGPRSIVDYSFSDSVHSDILLVPGGQGTRKEIENAALLEWLREQDAANQLMTSVCTGSALLARAGLLDGRQATSNKKAFQWVCSQNNKVDWQARARWVADGKYYTSSGVAAGIDMALAVIARLFGEAEADRVAILAEYERQVDATRDPFAGLHGLV